MQTWTLACDESGSFRSEEEFAYLVGGLLLPGTADSTDDIRSKFSDICRSSGITYPPHATVLRRNRKDDVVDRLLVATGRWLRSHGGLFVALISRPPKEGSDAALHVRMLGALVQLCGRLAAAQGARSLDLRLASRGFVVTSDMATQAKNAGLYVRKDDDGWHLAGVLGTEAREALDSLGRLPCGVMAGWPAIQSVRVSSAENPSTHAAVVAANLLCNSTYGAVRDKHGIRVSELTAAYEGWTAENTLIVDYNVLSPVLAVDDALRKTPPNLHDLGAALHAARSSGVTASTGTVLRLGVEGAIAAAELFWKLGERHVVGLCEHDPNLAWSVAQRLAGDAQVELDMKHGAYEGTMTSLTCGFAGERPLARLVRGVKDRELRARLLRLTLECQNHRGDVEGAEGSYAAFRSEFDRGTSLFLLSEALKVENLANVVVQNELPAAVDQLPGISARLRDRATKLRELAGEINQLPSLTQLVVGSDDPGTGGGRDELELRRLAGFAGRLWNRPDREHGRCLGTAARSLAFLGDLDGAMALALEARSYFADSPFDLQFNACVLARIELERARLQRPNPDLLDLLFRLASVTALVGVPEALAAIAANPANRFQLDLLLRRLLWAPPGPGAAEPRPFVDELGRGRSSDLYVCLQGQASHPTELIARHAAELLNVHGRRQKAVAAWFDLSVALSQSAPANSTLHRLLAFTLHLSEGKSAQDAPGSLLNPCFEYR